MNIVELDLRGLKCPLPVLRARKALRGLAPGIKVCVLATDPMSAIDIPHMCNEDGHTLIAAEKLDERTLRFHIRRGETSPEATGKS